MTKNDKAFHVDLNTISLVNQKDYNSEIDSLKLKDMNSLVVHYKCWLSDGQFLTWLKKRHTKH